MFLIRILFKMDSSYLKQVPIFRPAPNGGDSSSKITATILNNATEESQEIDHQQIDPQKNKSEMSELPSSMQSNEPLLSQRPLLAATVPIDDYSGFEQGCKLDKGSASSFIDQCIADHLIQTSVVTPMDRIIIAQALNNPHPDYQEEIITVQIVYPHLQIDDGTIQKDKRPQSQMKNFKHHLEMHDSHESKFKKCKLCLNDIQEKEKHYNCKDKACQEINNEEDFLRVGPCTYCAKCLLSSEVRRLIENKTKLQNLVQLYHLDQTDAQQEQIKQNVNLNEGKVDNQRITIEEMPISRDTKDPDPETILYKSKHAIIGLWRRNNSGYNECYRQFRIDHPVTQKRFLGDSLSPQLENQDAQDFKLEPFFYVGDKGGLYYFTQTQTSDHLLAKKQEFYLQQFDLAQACRIKIDSTNLRTYYRNLYFPPIKVNKLAVGNFVGNLLESIFFQNPENGELRALEGTTQSKFDPQFFESAGYLALSINKAAPLNDFSSNNLVDTKYTNIFFCRLDQPSIIDKIIYNGCVVLKVQLTSKQITDVWYTCFQNLNQISWKNEIDQSQLTRTLLQDHSPEQKLASCYAFSGKPGREEKWIYELKEFLSNKKRCIQVQGVMHNNDQRVSFVLTNLCFMTFEINKETNKAVLLWRGKRDARFCFSKDGSLFICFNLSQDKEQEKDLNSIKIDCRSLDAKKPDEPQNEVEQDKRRGDFKIEFKIDNHLTIENNLSNYPEKLPYQFTDFITWIKDGKQEFMVSLHFLDSDTHQPNLYFLKGNKIGLGDDEECTNQTFVRKQATTQYPILIQNTELPRQNQLFIANMSLNEPQKQIDLGDYRFICFVETGLKNSEIFWGQGKVGIFFLALQPNGHIKLMQFCTNPWLTREKETNVIKIFSGFIHDEKLTQPTKIKGAALLFYRWGPTHDELLIKIVVQFQEEIKVFSLNDPKYPRQLNLVQSQLEERTAKLHMVCNQNMIFYVKRYGTTEEKIICVHHKNPDIEEQVAYTSSSQILQLQAKQDGVPTSFEQSLYIIDSQSRFLEIKCNIKDLKFEVVTPKKMLRAEQIIHKLKNYNWQRLALSSRSVTASFIKGDDRSIWKNAITYNLTSGNIFKHDFLGYKADVEINNYKEYYNQIRKKNCQVLSVQHLAAIGKILLQVQEGNFYYYLLMQSLDNRRIDLLSHQPSYYNYFYFSNEIQLKGNLIVVQFEKQSIIFENKDLMQKQTQSFFNGFHSFEGKICITKNQILSNYLYEQKKILNKETEKVDMILRSNPCGRFTTIYSSLKNYIDKQRTAIDFQLKKEFEGQAGEEERCRDYIDKEPPDFFVTSKGTLVLSFLLAQSKKKESDIVAKGENLKDPEPECTFQILKYTLPYQNENLEAFNAGINDLTEDEKKVIIYVKKNDTLQTDRLRFYQTEHFFVIQGMNKIFFKKLALMNDTERKQECRSVDKIEDFSNFQGIKTLIESKKYCYQFECIDLSKMFTEKEQQNDYSLTVILGKQPDNVIQISFKDIAVLWDLEKNQEISQITNFNQFQTPETMIPSPFQFPKTIRVGQKKKTYFQEQTNDQNILLLKDEDYRDSLFKMYTMLDLLEMQAIHQSLKKQGSFKNSTPIDLESVLAFFYGKTFFQLFQENPEVIQSFLMQLKEKNLQKQKNEHDVELDNIYVRRLFRTLKAQTTIEVENQESLIFKRYQSEVFEQPKLSGLSIFQEQLIQNQNLLLLETLIEIVLFSSEVDISLMITDVEHFKKVIDNIHRSWISAFMDKVLKTNAQTEEVYNMPWDEKNKIVVFTANSSQLSSQEIKKQAQVRMRTQTTVSYWHSRLIELINRNKKSKKLEPPTLNFKLVPVKVKMIEISWLTRGLKDFYLHVTCSDNETLYDIELIRVLLTSQDYGSQLIYRVFFPYLILMGALLYYFGVCVNVPHTEGFFGGESVGLRCFIFSYQLFFLGVEVKQMHNLKKHYWTDLWNFFYLLQFALNYLVIIEHSTSCFHLDHSQLTQLTACSTILLWAILFYWMRISDDLGFYVHLISQTLKDTKSFLILVLMVLITFANALYILEIANHPSAAVSDDTALTQPAKDGADEIGRLIKRAYNVTFIDSVVNQYLLGLGEFQYDEFESSPSGPLIWSLFLLSTFLTQVTFMNMLIAIMSDTFTRVLENKERYGLQQKTQITADFIYALSFTKMITEKHYLYIIEPANTSKNEDANMGAQEEMSDKVHAFSEKISAKVDASREEMSAKVDASREEMSAKVDALTKKVDAQAQQMTAIQDLLQKLINQRLN